MKHRADGPCTNRLGAHRQGRLHQVPGRSAIDLDGGSAITYSTGMEALDLRSVLTLQELCDEVNRLRRGVSGLGKTDPVGGRTVRFYVERELLPSVRPGPGKKYPYETVWRVLFIRLLSTKHGMPLEYLHDAMNSVDADTMRRVVTGEEPLEVLTAPDEDAAQRHRARGYQVKALRPVAERAESGEVWQVLAQTGDAVLRIRDGLPSAKRKQLSHIAALIRALDEAD